MLHKSNDFATNGVDNVVSLLFIAMSENFH